MCIRDSSERECEERLGGQRADFPQVVGETEFSQAVYEDRVSSRSYAEDKVSSSTPLNFCKPGKARKWYSKFVVPFAGSEVGQWCCDRCCLLYTSSQALNPFRFSGNLHSFQEVVQFSSTYSIISFMQNIFIYNLSFSLI